MNFNPPSFDDFHKENINRHLKKEEDVWGSHPSDAKHAARERMFNPSEEIEDPIPLSEPLSVLEIAKVALLESQYHATPLPSTDEAPKRDRERLRSKNYQPGDQ